MKASHYSIERQSTYGLESFILTIVTVDRQVLVRSFMSKQGAMTAWLNHLNKYN